jgi:hypothetical protein
MAASRHQIQNSKQLRRPVVRSQVPNHHHPTIRNRTACLAAFSQQLLIKHARTDRDPRAQRTGQLLPKSSQSWPPDSNGPTTLPRRSARSVRLPKLAAEIVDPKRHERASARERKEIRNQLRGSGAGLTVSLGCTRISKCVPFRVFTVSFMGVVAPGPEAPLPRRGARF